MMREDGLEREVGGRVGKGTSMHAHVYIYVCTLPGMCVVGVHTASCACITVVTIQTVCIIQFIGRQFGMHN